MAGHCCTIDEVNTCCARKQGWRTVGVAAIAFAAAATLVVAAKPSASTQNWVQASSSTATRATAGARLYQSNTRSFAQVADIAQDVPVSASSAVFVREGPAHGHLQGATLAGFGLVFVGAAAALARQLLSRESVAMFSASSEKAGETRQKMLAMVNTLDSSDMKLLSRGGSMEEVARSKGIDEVAAAIRADQLSRKDLTPKDVILEMQRGNGRFWMGLSERPEMSAIERRALIMAQAPKICILSCSDSRVPVEIIFDQGLGEVFVVRMAGNILDANAHGSIEFAVKYLGVKVVLVIGHEGCGAVKGAISMSNEDISKEPFDLQAVLQSIKSGLDVKELNAISDSRSRDREAIVLNTMNQVKRLQQNQLLAEKVSDGSLLVAGAFYEISSGIVDFFSLDKNGFVVDL